MASTATSGITDKPSQHSVEQTVERITLILQAKGVKLFTLIDHSGEVETAGLEMRPTKLPIFGNPKAGTPLMVAAPRSAIDLPLKLLIWEDELGERHGLPAELLADLAEVETLAARAGA